MEKKKFFDIVTISIGLVLLLAFYVSSYIAFSRLSNSLEFGKERFWSFSKIEAGVNCDMSIIRAKNPQLEKILHTFFLPLITADGYFFNNRHVQKYILRPY